MAPAPSCSQPAHAYDLPTSTSASGASSPSLSAGSAEPLLSFAHSHSYPQAHSQQHLRAEALARTASASTSTSTASESTCGGGGPPRYSGASAMAPDAYAHAGSSAQAVGTGAGAGGVPLHHRGASSQGQGQGHAGYAYSQSSSDGAPESGAYSGSAYSPRLAQSAGMYGEGEKAESALLGGGSRPGARGGRLYSRSMGGGGGDGKAGGNAGLKAAFLTLVCCVLFIVGSLGLAVVQRQPAGAPAAELKLQKEAWPAAAGNPATPAPPSPQQAQHPQDGSHPAPPPAASLRPAAQAAAALDAHPGNGAGSGASAAPGSGGGAHGGLASTSSSGEGGWFAWLFGGKSGADIAAEKDRARIQAEKDAARQAVELAAAAEAERQRKKRPTYYGSAALAPEWEWARNVSLVYTWVNGSDPHMSKLRKDWGGQVGGNRDRDNEDLRFSLRTVQKHLPWHTGTIYIVSPTPPAWARLGGRITADGAIERQGEGLYADSRLVWCDQNAIIPKDAQPTFSSNVVEQYLHLVPGVTEHFIHSNDDYMYVAPVHPREFFTPQKGVRQFLEKSTIKVPDDYGRGGQSSRGNIWRASVYNTVVAIERAYAPLDHYEPRWLKHAPFVYTRAAYFGMHARFYRELRVTAQHRFRSNEDVITPLLVHAYVAHEGAHALGLRFEIMPEAEAAASTMLVKWKNRKEENDRAANAVRKRIASGALKFLTINDEIGTGPRVPEAQAGLRAFYEELFGTEKSRFEL